MSRAICCHALPHQRQIPILQLPFFLTPKMTPPKLREPATVQVWFPFIVQLQDVATRVGGVEGRVRSNADHDNSREAGKSTTIF